ncbi:hypothetical protein [Mucilaginibacter aquariorum]|uniref:Uncharacterized protein n=1 Tax=Mucilaginibacter aquariorum TaxID=2967225 RepID=A0ABT1T8D0_9SPHI|nr:hypothetical protein [Mucilaginibacter aquariorum]MCQ6960873.1 hypothetical protein [Mucilaginibacter aquariorum]
MYKKLLCVLLLAFSISACKKNNNKPACELQACTAMFAYLGIVYNNHNGDAAQVKDVTIVNLRTGKTIIPPSYPPAASFVAGFVLIASDGTKDEFSAEGDDVRITATSVTTGQVNTTILKISNGCNCHVTKVSGPETVTFD